MSNIRITQEVVEVIITVLPASFTGGGNGGNGSPPPPPSGPGQGNPGKGHIGSTGCIDIPLLY